ncbi:MAG: N-acyl homoserine lactonase family protein [Archaeoglobus sp.]|uniref:N-acyl homoserine lactonase family protein n=1 Tax=Archaeoglobus sp. TaxID=1872626 RepID=UPI001D6AAF69|nr:N-acyl homoserine lactonase family protein [Archaeoglobus sp.]MBO8180557.1 N-acyl homoserine lactonase family protein [Archaeoglobus sp.]
MYRIMPLKVAEISVPLGAVLMMGDMRVMTTGPVYVWVIDGEDEKIVVDSGVEEAKNGLFHGFPGKGGGEKGLREALESVNLKPEDVDKLIITHLHFDHAANAKLFTNARIYVQRREWESALNPPLHYREIYDASMLHPLEEMDLCLIEGDVEIADGVRTVLLPGHTKGLQGVAVETERGKYLIAGDHFYTYLNFFPPKHPIQMTDIAGNTVEIPASSIPFLPPGLHVDLTEWYESCFKALSYVKRQNILPGHDPSLEGRIFP